MLFYLYLKLLKKHHKNKHFKVNKGIEQQKNKVN